MLDKRSANLGSEFDVVDSIGRLVSNFTIGDAKLAGRRRGMTIEFGRAHGALFAKVSQASKETGSGVTNPAGSAFRRKRRSRVCLIAGHSLLR